MQTFVGFHSIQPGTWFFSPLATRDTAKEEAVSKRIPRTFQDVPEGYMFDTTHLGKPFPFLKLKKVHLINSSRRGSFRKANVVFCREGELMWLDPKTPVYRVRVPERSHFRRLRRDFFVDMGKEIVVVNAVHEDADIANDPDSHSGDLEYFTEPVPAR